MATWIWRITERGRQLKILIEKVDFFSKCFYGILKYLYHFTHCTCVICIRLDFLQLSWTVICLSMWNLFVVSTRVSLPSNITNIIYIFTWFTPFVVICHTAWWYKLSTVISMMPRFLRISQYQISNREETFILYYWSNNRQDTFILFSSTFLNYFSAILDIPVYKGSPHHNEKIQALHVLFTLYSEFKNSQVR